MFVHEALTTAEKRARAPCQILVTQMSCEEEKDNNAEKEGIEARKCHQFEQKPLFYSIALKQGEMCDVEIKKHVRMG